MQKTKLTISHFLIGILLAALMVACGLLVHQNRRHEDALRQCSLEVYSGPGDRPFPPDVVPNTKEQTEMLSDEEVQREMMEMQNPGLKALVDASSEIAVVEVVNTKPRKAIEGARDTVELRVLRPIKGGLTAEQAIGVYYHLLWVDTDKRVLETPKFQKGSHYVIFLKASTIVDGEKRTVEYRLTDSWLSVQSANPELERVAAALAAKM